MSPERVHHMRPRLAATRHFWWRRRIRRSQTAVTLVSTRPINARSAVVRSPKPQAITKASAKFGDQNHNSRPRVLLLGENHVDHCPYQAISAGMIAGPAEPPTARQNSSAWGSTASGSGFSASSARAVATNNAVEPTLVVMSRVSSSLRTQPTLREAMRCLSGWGATVMADIISGLRLPGAGHVWPRGLVPRLRTGLHASRRTDRRSGSSPAGSEARRR
jgi:hypothetical protein